MATRQYIGARYVPKFYQNSVDGSTQWESNVVYEPLMYVTLTNGHMYISKKQVPATVGSPVNNIDYWLDIGSYNGFIEQLQNEIDTINDVTIPAVQADVTLKQNITDNNLTTTDKTVVGAINELVTNKQDKTDNTLTTTDKTVVGAINELVTNKQDKTDNTLTTTDKTVVGAINELDSEIDIIKSKKRKLLFISDSYAISCPWDEWCVQEMGLATDQYTLLRQGGIGFSRAGHKILDYLMSQSITDKDSYTDIVIVGGANDRDSTAADLDADISAFKTYCKTEYPNATISVGFIAWSADRTYCGQYRSTRLNYIDICSKYGIKYMVGVEGCMHDMALIDTTGVPPIHPLATANKVIGGAIAQALLNGCARVFKPANATFTPDASNITSSNTYIYDGYMDGNDFYINTQQLVITLVNAVTANQTIKIGDYACNTFKSNLQLPVLATTGEWAYLTFNWDGTVRMTFTKAHNANEQLTFYINKFVFNIMQT